MADLREAAGREGAFEPPHGGAPPPASPSGEPGGAPAAAESSDYSWRKALSLCQEIDRFLGEGEVQKEKSAFAAQLGKMPADQFGVKKGLTQMTAHSRWEASPKWSMRPRIPVDIRASSAPPGPGTYDSKPTVGVAPSYGFGIGHRFREQNRETVGPCKYQPKNPLHSIGAKIGFGTSVRVPMGASVIMVPGPGAYEFKSSMGSGVMYTAQGKTASSYLQKQQDVPGPGAYTPGWRYNSSIKEPTKPGFGTSSRDAPFERSMKNPAAPGPGTYEMQNFKGLGREGIKYSAQARRRGGVADTNEIVGNPGPGTYNSHVTSFGY